MNFPIPELNQIFKTDESLKGIFSIWGDFGLGKTTFALQIAINASKQGKILYIFSKPNFPYERLRKILPEKPSNILNNISFILSPNFANLFTITTNLEFLILNQLMEDKTSIKLLIIDSLTDLYRLELNRERKEQNVSLNYQLNQILANLHYINETYGVEILIVNEISRKSYDDEVVEVQSGGKVMDYWVLYSIKLDRTEQINIRNIHITKHPKNKNLSILSELTAHGFE